MGIANRKCPLRAAALMSISETTQIPNQRERAENESRVADAVHMNALLAAVEAELR